MRKKRICTDSNRAEILSLVDKPFNLCSCGLAGIHSDLLGLRHHPSARLQPLPVAHEGVMGQTSRPSSGSPAYQRSTCSSGRLMQSSRLIFWVCSFCRFWDCCGTASHHPCCPRRELLCCVSVPGTRVVLVTLFIKKTVVILPLKKKRPCPSLKWNVVFLR